jgi:hypothetical protein
MLRLPFYVVFDRYANNLRLFGLERGHYQEIILSEPDFGLMSWGLAWVCGKGFIRARSVLGCAGMMRREIG